MHQRGVDSKGRTKQLNHVPGMVLGITSLLLQPLEGVGGVCTTCLALEII